MKIYLHNRGSIDLGQNPYEPVYGTKSDYFSTIQDFDQAKKKQKQYINFYGLSSANYTGGYITNYLGVLVGFLNNKGQLWLNGKEFEDAVKDFKILMDKEWAKELTKLN